MGEHKVLEHSGTEMLGAEQLVSQNIRGDLSGGTYPCAPLVPTALMAIETGK